MQPMTDGTRVALVVAQQWRERDAYKGPWVFYTPHRQRWNGADDERAAWTAQALWLALMKAERRARVRHLPYRAMHGFRRAIAGDVLELTRDLKLALDWIGDVDLGMARRYLRPRDPRLEEAATAVDRLLGEIDWGGRTRTSNFPVNSRAVCQLTYTPKEQLQEAGRPSCRTLLSTSSPPFRQNS